MTTSAGVGSRVGVLKWRSQVTSTKLRAFAEQLLSDIRELEYDSQLPPRTTFDQLLLTAHERVTK